MSKPISAPKIPDRPLARMAAMARRTTSALVVAGLAATVAMPASAQQDRIAFWTMNYGDLIDWNNTMRDLSAQFQQETGIAVQVEVVNWSVAFQTYLTVSQGGAHPDCADMYWLHSFSAIGGDQYGPMPINEYRDRWPNLEDEFFEGYLQDASWQGDFYGIPWRGDIRAFLYRTDAFEEAGITAPPDNWDEIIELARELTVRDENGNVDRWGFRFGSATNQVSWLLPYYWQNGGSFMTEDGRTATIDNQEMRETLEWMRDMIWEHEVVNPDIMERGQDALPEFVAGRVAMIGSAEQAWGVSLDRDYPEADGLWAMSISPEGPVSRDSFSGGGYWGVLRGSDKVEQCVAWIEFLSRAENMQRITEAAGNVSTRRSVMESDFWSDRPWKVVVNSALEYARTSQHPAPAWSAIAAPEPGAVLFDMMYDAIILRQDIDEVVSRAQERMQAELDRSAT